MKKIYLAGPMSGYENLNFTLFHAETARLRGLGYDVINPAEINPLLPAQPSYELSEMEKVLWWRACMRADIRQLVDCDGIALLPGWQKSPGATLEHHIALSLGFAIANAADIRCAA